LNVFDSLSVFVDAQVDANNIAAAGVPAFDLRVGVRHCAALIRVLVVFNQKLDLFLSIHFDLEMH